MPSEAQNGVRGSRSACPICEEEIPGQHIPDHLFQEHAPEGVDDVQ